MSKKKLIFRTPYEEYLIMAKKLMSTYIIGQDRVETLWDKPIVSKKTLLYSHNELEHCRKQNQINRGSWLLMFFHGLSLKEEFNNLDKPLPVDSSQRSVADIVFNHLPGYLLVNQAARSLEYPNNISCLPPLLVWEFYYFFNVFPGDCFFYGNKVDQSQVEILRFDDGRASLEVIPLEEAKNGFYLECKLPALIDKPSF